MPDTIRKRVNLNSPRTETLGGNAFWDTVYHPTLDANIGYYHFLKDVNGKWYGDVNIPLVIGPVPAAKIILQMHANAIVGVTSLQVSTLTYAVGQSPDQAMTAEAVQNITVENIAYEMSEVVFPLTNQPAAGQNMIVEVFHEGLNVNDTLAVTTLIKQVQLEIDLS